MNEHEVSELLRRANVIDVADLPDPEESPEAQFLLATILESAKTKGRREAAQGTGRRGVILRHRLALGFVAAVVVGGASVAAAVFPRSSETSTGLSAFSTRGTPTSFSSDVGIRGLGTPYVLARSGEEVMFRVDRPGASTCYGSGKFKDGKLDVLLLDCTPFPSATTPVLLDEVGVDASAGSGHGTLLSIEGFAADGVAEVRLIAASGQVIVTAPVNGNTFRFNGVEGVPQAGAKLIALDPTGHEVWSRAL